jgi:hypothetical protein
MADLSTIPEIVNITHLAGDTLTIRFQAPQSLITGKDWLGQIRANRQSDTVDATFVITPPPDDTTPGTIVLPAAETARLAGTMGTLMTLRRTTREAPTPTLTSMMIYEGVYDVQISVDGSDPVTTLMMGTLKIELDVSREAV